MNKHFDKELDKYIKDFFKNDSSLEIGYGKDMICIMSKKYNISENIDFFINKKEKYTLQITDCIKIPKQLYESEFITKCGVKPLASAMGI